MLVTAQEPGTVLATNTQTLESEDGPVNLVVNGSPATGPYKIRSLTHGTGLGMIQNTNTVHIYNTQTLISSLDSNTITLVVNGSPLNGPYKIRNLAFGAGMQTATGADTVSVAITQSLVSGAGPINLVLNGDPSQGPYKVRSLSSSWGTLLDTTGDTVSMRSTAVCTVSVFDVIYTGPHTLTKGTFPMTAQGSNMTGSCLIFTPSNDIDGSVCFVVKGPNLPSGADSNGICSGSRSTVWV
jgi:hypothetical protein